MLDQQTRTSLVPFVEKKWWYFGISLATIIPGLIFLMLGGLKLGVEFQGGSLLEARFERPPAVAEMKDVFTQLGHPEATIQGADGGRMQVRTIEMSAEEIGATQRVLAQRYPSNYRDLSASVVSASFSGELIQNAVYAIALASLLIVFLIAFGFRQFGWSAFRYGVAAILALLHDAAVVLGLFAMLGYFFHVEVDSLFVTAVLTIIGFSVHDTIVVFDRIRENLRVYPGEALNPIINYSIMQTAARSVVTSLTVILTLLALYFFGGFSIRNFALALLVGVVSGTYSSIFNAAQVVSLWQEIEDRIKRRRAQRATA